MLTIDSVLELFAKYGYSSITSHPYVYLSGEQIGICYKYDDEEFGTLERVRICKTTEEVEEFLKAHKWVETNGKARHVRMILDNYEGTNPKVMFLRNEKIMVQGEMYDIDSYDSREAMRKDLSDVAKLIYEAGDLLLVYDEIKGRQLDYLKNLLSLKNLLRAKYFELQTEVDTYNRNKIKRELVELKTPTELGINDALEISLKDKYNLYLTQMPQLQDGQDLLKEVWDMNYNLELNEKYYDAIREDSSIRNEMKVVEQKIALMKELNDDLKGLFGVDLVKKFQAINKKCKDTSADISEETVNTQMEAVKRKYSYYSKIDPLYTSDYLREAIQNSNYEGLVDKYKVGANVEALSKFKMPLNEVAADLLVKYKEKFSVEEQSILVLYNNDKYRILFDTIINIPNFDGIDIKEVLGIVNKIKNISKIKTECYTSVKNRIDNPVNESIKKSLFNDVDFTSFETFISSMIKKLSILKLMKDKMVLPGDINMYLAINDINMLNTISFTNVTSNLDELVNQVKDTNDMIGITLVRSGVSVMYSPYYFDLGDTLSKNGAPEMYIKEMVNLELLIDTSEINVEIDPNRTNVIRYESKSTISDNVAIVGDLEVKATTMFCKYIITKKDNTQVEVLTT